MEEIYEELKKHKPKHNLEFWLEYNKINGWIHFTIFNAENWNRAIPIYDFHGYEDVRKKINHIKKLMNNKRKALKFIGEPR